MKNIIQRTTLAGTLCALALTEGSALRADETVIPAAPIKAAVAPAGYRGLIEYDGKVMVVNRAEQTLTIQIQNKLHLFRIQPPITIVKKNRPVTLKEVMAGQKVIVVARTTTEGTLQLVSLSIDLIQSESQPAGSVDNAKGSSGSTATGNLSSSGKTSPPYQGGSYPAYVERVIVSPNK